MTPREAAEKRELELALDYFAKRNFKNAGDAAELKAGLEQAGKEVADLKADLVAARAMIPDTPAL